MSSKTNELVRNLTEAIVNTGKKKTSPYDTSATVNKVEGGKAYVHIPGGVDETPADLTINANPGDTVQVRVAGGRAFLIGNRTSPPTDDATAIRASKRAVEAYEQAVDAQKSALDAADAAEAAQESADQAAEAASNAQESADIAHTAAENAQADADSAQSSATSALNSANSALTQLSIVEDVSGTLNWIKEHGTYVATTDTTVNPDTIYFEMEDEDYVPIVNHDPEANPAESGWYVLDVTDSQSDYIMAHLAVTSAGLWVLPSGQWAMHPLTDSDGDYLINSDGDYVSDWSKDPQNASGYKVLLSATGMTVFDGEGVAVASYGAEMILGRLDSGNLIARPTGIAIRDGLEELATFSASGSQIGGDAGKNVQVVPDAIKFNDGSDQIAGMYSYINTMDLGGGDTLTNAGTNFALSGEYNTDTGTWDTPHHAMMSGIHVVNTESPGLVNDIAEIEAFAENEQDSSKTSRSSMQTTASDMGLASYDVSLRVGTDFKHISYQLLNTGSSSLSIEADSFDISNNFIVDQNGNLECNNVGVPKYLTNPTIAKTSGNSTCSVIAFSGYGKMRHLILSFATTAAISAGTNIFDGTISSDRPHIAIGGCGYGGATPVMATINARGRILARACGSIASGSTIWVYFTYFVA